MSLWNKTAKLDPSLTIADLQARANEIGIQTAPARSMTANELASMNSISAREHGMNRDDIMNEYDANRGLAGPDKAVLDLAEDGSINVGDSFESLKRASDIELEAQQHNIDRGPEPEPEHSYNDAWSINDDR